MALAAQTREPAPVHVLIVEDDPVTLTVAQAMFRACGCEVTTLNKGDNVSEQYRRHHFDLIVLDFYMPKLNGRKIAKIIRKTEEKLKRAPCPIIVVTGATESISTPCCEPDVAAWYYKPYSLNTVRHVVETFAYGGKGSN